MRTCVYTNTHAHTLYLKAPVLQREIEWGKEQGELGVSISRDGSETASLSREQLSSDL